MDEITLDTDQQQLLDTVVRGGKNLFFTGSAGSGKSVLLRAIIKAYREKHGSGSIAVTATTGLAATQIGGCTLHSFAGIGLGNLSTQELIRKVTNHKMAKARWNNCSALVVDEISMLDAVLLDKLDEISKAVRDRPNEPFGGIQLLATGDFFQLPPIGNNNEEVQYAFEAKCWNELFPMKSNNGNDGGSQQRMLTHIHRQHDTEFISLLQNLRQGIVTPQMEKKLGVDLARPVDYPNGLISTELFPTRNQVQAANISRLNALKTPLVRFEATDYSSFANRFHLEKLQRDCIANSVVELKVGAQVMLLKNLSNTLVNGSLGIIKKFVKSACDDSGILGTSSEPLPLVEFTVYGAHGIDPTASETILVQRDKWTVEEKGRTLASRIQIPLALAYSLSIHKSQGATISRLKVDVGRVFERGQIYVAVSRAQSMDRLEIYNFDKSKIMVDERVLNYMKNLENALDINTKSIKDTEIAEKSGVELVDAIEGVKLEENDSSETTEDDECPKQSLHLLTLQEDHRCYACNALLHKRGWKMKLCGKDCKEMFWSIEKWNANTVDIFMEDSECMSCGQRNDPSGHFLRTDLVGSK